MEKVLVTGVAGFIDGYLVDRFVKNFEVIVLDNLSIAIKSLVRETSRE